MSDQHSNPSPEDDTTQEKLDLAGKHAKHLQAIVARVLRLENARREGKELKPDEVRFLKHAREQVYEAYQPFLELLPEVEREQTVFSPLDLMACYWDRQAERREMAATGFKSLDMALSGGLERDRLYILLGAPGSGKTTLANQIADHIACGRAVLYVSSEDAPMALLCKTIARRSTIEYSAVLRGYKDEKDKINAAFADYGTQPQVHHLRYVDATQGISLQEIADQAEQHFKALEDSTKGDPVIIVDYLQRLVRAEDRYLRAQTGGAGALGIDARQAATTYTEKLRELACDLHCSVVCLSAMNRASGYNNASSNLISAAKESGDIEYTADVILAIGPDEETTLPEPGAFASSVTIAKNRQGLNSATGARIDLAWYPTFQRFIPRESVDPDAEETNSKGNGRYPKRAKK